MSLLYYLSPSFCWRLLGTHGELYDAGRLVVIVIFFSRSPRHHPPSSPRSPPRQRPTKCSREDNERGRVKNCGGRASPDRRSVLARYRWFLWGPEPEVGRLRGDWLVQWFDFSLSKLAAACPPARVFPLAPPITRVAGWRTLWSARSTSVTLQSSLDRAWCVERRASAASAAANRFNKSAAGRAELGPNSCRSDPGPAISSARRRDDHVTSLRDEMVDNENDCWRRAVDSTTLTFHCRDNDRACSQLASIFPRRPSHFHRVA